MARLVKRAGGEVVLIIKDNPPATRADLELFFEDQEVDRRTWQSFEHIEKGHGRLERHHITISPDLNDYLRRDWGEVGQVFRVEGERQSKDQQSRQVVYGWTTLSPKQCSPERLAQLIRRHWAVEIVQSQLTKTNLFAGGGGGDHITDLHLVIGDHHAIRFPLVC